MPLLSPPARAAPSVSQPGGGVQAEVEQSSSRRGALERRRSSGAAQIRAAARAEEGRRWRGSPGAYGRSSCAWCGAAGGPARGAVQDAHGRADPGVREAEARRCGPRGARVG
ncbi:hypothetical protein GQ55_3G299400 [Panicum hallii var. hallii]|uniref:Uncharacterized protein n=1 Tax=Panicum hallii var. hallii TaxID=1504633 RepID=A0A2T7EES3_9POAL|nr:hypothetical protein GQ55_3G299400 [Panicum hallii var. hallii]